MEIRKVATLPKPNPREGGGKARALTPKGGCCLLLAAQIKIKKG
jgi:hypothetical protein